MDKAITIFKNTMKEKKNDYLVDQVCQVYPRDQADPVDPYLQVCLQGPGKHNKVINLPPINVNNLSER